MKVSLFAQAPYRYLPEDFEQSHESVCSVPYSLATREGVYSSIRDFMDELMFGAQAGFDALAVTEHGQSSYDMVPNPDLVASALAYMTEAEGIDVAIYPMGRSLGKSREPLRVAEEYAMIDVMCGGRLVRAWSSDSPTTPASTTASRRSRCGSASTRTSSSCCVPGAR